MPANHASGTQGIISSSEFNRDMAGVQGTYGWAVQSAAVTFSSGLIFNVAAAAAGDYTVNSVSGSVYAGGTITLATQDPTNPRIDIIVITSAGAVSNVTGTPAALTVTSGPVPPTPSATQLEIARIYVPATGTSLSASSITDRRVPLVNVVSAFDSVRNSFRAGRRLLGEYFSSGLQIRDGTLTLFAAGYGPGMVIGSNNTAAVPTVTQISGEQYDAWVTGGAVPLGIGSFGANTAATAKLPTAPNKSPRMLIRWIPGVSNANLTTTMAGFFAVTVDNAPAATSSGAYLRANTTGNLFFVTRQGGTETTTDLGVRPTVLTSYEIETTDAGVTWTCRNSTTGAVVATSTTNVPTAATAVGYGAFGLSGVGSINAFGLGYMRVEANFTP